MDCSSDLKSKHKRPSKRRKHRSRKSCNPILLIITILLLVVMGVSGTLFIRDIIRYQSASSKYKSLAEYFTIKDKPKKQAKKSEVVQEIAPYPAMDVDFKALSDINSDFIGVLYLPALDITYPVVHNKNNEEYLTCTFEGKTNPAGSIFLDCYASGELNGAKSIIYGHNMKNDSMFGKLNKFDSDSSMCADNPWFYIYMSGKVMKYRIFAYHITPVDSFVYDYVSDSNNYKSFVSKELAASTFKNENNIDFSTQPKIVTLSTCWGSGHTHNFVVTGALTDEFALSE